MIKKILYLSIFAVLLLKPNYGKAQCVPAGTQEFTGQMSQGNTYKISNNRYARRIPRRIPRGVTLYITGKARLDNDINISQAKEVHVCEGGGLSVANGGTNKNLIVGPYGAVKVDDPLNDNYYKTPILKENAVVALCGYRSNTNAGKQLTKYEGTRNGTSYFIVGEVYSYNMNNRPVSDKKNVTLIDYGIYFDPQRASPSSSGKKFQCYPKSISSHKMGQEGRCDKNFKNRDNPFYDSSANYQTNVDNVCDLNYLINHIPGYTPTTTTPQQQPISIRVDVSEDTDGDTEGDISLRRVNVDLYKSGRFITNKTTDAHGMITFDNNITPGTYTVEETDPRGYSSVWDTYYNGSSWHSDGKPKDNTVEVTVSAGQRADVEFVDRSNKLVCNPAGAKGQGEFLSSVVGISTLDRGNDTSWLNSVKNGQLVLDSKEKGLVIPRIANPSIINNASEGMIIYDTTNNCIKLYQNNKWGCLTKKKCITLP